MCLSVCTWLCRWEKHNVLCFAFTMWGWVVRAICEVEVWGSSPVCSPFFFLFLFCPSYVCCSSKRWPCPSVGLLPFLLFWGFFPSLSEGSSFLPFELLMGLWFLSYVVVFAGISLSTARLKVISMGLKIQFFPGFQLVTWRKHTSEGCVFLDKLCKFFILCIHVCFVSLSSELCFLCSGNCLAAGWCSYPGCHYGDIDVVRYHASSPWAFFFSWCYPNRSAKDLEFINIDIKMPLTSTHTKEIRMVLLFSSTVLYKFLH